MIRSTHAGRAVAVAGVLVLALTACSGGSDEAGEGGSGSGEPLKIGTLLPVTGSLAQLGPPEIAGVDLALDEINAAGGLFGADVTVVHTDSSDAQNASVSTASAQELITEGVSAVIGAASSSVTLNVIDDITGAGIVQVSPANTATSLSGYSDFYYRTAPPDTVQGDVLGNLIVSDGAANVGILVFNDSYGTSLRDVVSGVVEESGGTIVYGADGQEFDPAEQNFATIVGDAIAAQPDAIAILAFTDQTPLIVRELVAQGWDMSKTYFVDGNLQNFGTDGDTGFPADTLTGAQGTLPGAYPSEEFQGRMLEIDPELEEFSYGPEAYDATLLVALAALKGGASDGETIQANMAAVSGATDGTECVGWEECSALVEDGEEIAYQAVSGVGPFNDANDPSSAFIGVYEFGEENTYEFSRSEEGVVPES
ncbi:ABC transporter substrate-binding protein [Cellulomonas oligotrophica]|uniref:Branched-chain amino acid transport system substrate-binding protein n=1 Tax=Cellulomonas oligotrophica TaxID=931536 RepID=A0A7Y9JYA3_9CELL|nr:ABC transporter substrate-binding protein [Cellulomonas oligotrophica]NYD84860.1 branched-chain amino acid transport system substrate-binding protein [Cellulomonas oligotrophica]